MERPPKSTPEQNDELKTSKIDFKTFCRPRVPEKVILEGLESEGVIPENAVNRREKKNGMSFFYYLMHESRNEEENNSVYDRKPPRLLERIERKPNTNIEDIEQKMAAKEQKHQKHLRAKGESARKFDKRYARIKERIEKEREEKRARIEDKLERAEKKRRDRSLPTCAARVTRVREWREIQQMNTLEKFQAKLKRDEERIKQQEENRGIVSHFQRMKQRLDNIESRINPVERILDNQENDGEYYYSTSPHFSP